MCVYVRACVCVCVFVCVCLHVNVVVQHVPCVVGFMTKLTSRFNELVCCCLSG